MSVAQYEQMKEKDQAEHERQALAKRKAQVLDDVNEEYHEAERQSFDELNETAAKWFSGWIVEPLAALEHLTFGREQEMIRAREMLSSVVNHLWWTERMMASTWLPNAKRRYEALERSYGGPKGPSPEELEEAQENVMRQYGELELYQDMLTQAEAAYEQHFGPWKPRGKAAQEKGESIQPKDPRFKATLERIGKMEKRRGFRAEERRDQNGRAVLHGIDDHDAA